MADKKDLTKTEEDVTDNTAIASDPNVIGLIKLHATKGYLTYDELNDALLNTEYDSDKLSDVMSYLTDNDINFISVEEEEAMLLDSQPLEEDIVDEEDDKEPLEIPVKTLEIEDEIVDDQKNDDPVKLYLKDMGNVKLS